MQAYIACSDVIRFTQGAAQHGTLAACRARGSPQSHRVLYGSGSPHLTATHTPHDACPTGSVEMCEWYKCWSAQLVHNSVDRFRPAMFIAKNSVVRGTGIGARICLAFIADPKALGKDNSSIKFADDCKLLCIYNCSSCFWCRLKAYMLSQKWYPLRNGLWLIRYKKLSCRWQTARRFLPLNVSLNHSRSLKIIQNWHPWVRYM